MHCVFLFGFGCAGDGSQGLVCARWVLYHWAPSLALTMFLFSVFSCFDIWGLLTQENLFPGLTSSLGLCALQKQTNHSRAHAPNCTFIEVSGSGLLFTCPSCYCTKSSCSTYYRPIKSKETGVKAQKETLFQSEERIGASCHKSHLFRKLV
jgi:hypothetical protein